MVMPMCWSLTNLMPLYKGTLVARAEAVDEIVSPESFTKLMKNASMFGESPQLVRS